VGWRGERAIYRKRTIRALRRLIGVASRRIIRTVFHPHDPALPGSLSEKVGVGECGGLALRSLVWSGFIDGSVMLELPIATAETQFGVTGGDVARDGAIPGDSVGGTVYFSLIMRLCENSPHESDASGG
jgi:hypothetical protein